MTETDNEQCSERIEKREDEYEYPFRVTDFHGEVVADELDNVPPLLNQEEIDLLASHLSRTTITSVEVWSAFKKLPDSHYGVGEPGDAYPSCQKCSEEIQDGMEFTTSFGYFYCRPCMEAAHSAMKEEREA